MKVLVTGGMGFIGSHTVVELYNAGFEPIIVDNLANSNAGVLEGLEKIIGMRPAFYPYDLTKKESVREIFSKHKIQGVIHFAAYKAVGESVENPLAYYKNNLLSTLHTLALMEEFGVKSFIFSSSCTVYGQPQVLPVNEQSPIPAAASPYGNTKQICEEIISDTVHASKHFSAISLRYFNPVGAHASAHIGELPQGVPNNLLPYLLKVVGGELESLSVFGDDYETPDGTCIRDYIHVVDLALAHVIAMRRLVEGGHKKNFEVFNLGTGTGYSVLDVIRAFEKVTGEKVNYKIAPRRAGDVEKIYADPSFASDELGWQAKYGLEDMLKSAWKWHQKITIS